MREVGGTRFQFSPRLLPSLILRTLPATSKRPKSRTFGTNKGLRLRHVPSFQLGALGPISDLSDSVIGRGTNVDTRGYYIEFLMGVAFQNVARSPSRILP